MFMWKYFFLYVFLGFLAGFTNPSEVPYEKRPIHGIFPIIMVVLIGFIIWNFATFGVSWGFLSIGETALGYFFGRSLARSNP